MCERLKTIQHESEHRKALLLPAPSAAGLAVLAVAPLAVAVAAAAGVFSLAAPSAPAGVLRMSLEVREDTPPTAHPVQVAAWPAAPGLIAITSFSVWAQGQGGTVNN